MNISSSIWTDDNKLRAVFSWLTRIGAAPKFGSRPIGWYQQSQCEAIDSIKAALIKANLPEDSNLRCKHGVIQGYHAGASVWVNIATASDLYR